MQNIRLPWGAWYKETKKEIYFPNTWSVDTYGKSHFKKLNTISLIKQLRLNFIFSQLRSCKKIGIVIDDLTRPTPSSEICTPLVKFLSGKGISPASIHIFLATGAHRQLHREDIIKKVGRLVYKKCPIHHHSPFCNLEYLGETSLNTPIYVNKDFLTMDFKMAIGTVLPHSSVGFSGGAKLIIPGLSGIKTIKSFHRSSPDRKGKFADITTNVLRADIDEAGKMVNVDIYIQTVCNPDRSIAKIYVEKELSRYKEITEYVKKKACFLINKSYDVGIFNAYPIDTEFVQAGKALDIVRVTKNRIINKNGVIILSSAASEGHGFHHLRSPGMIAPFDGDWSASYRNRKLVFFGENITPQMLPQETQVKTSVFNRWDQLLKFLEKRYEKATVAVFPYASIQIPEYTGD